MVDDTTSVKIQELFQIFGSLDLAQLLGEVELLLLDVLLHDHLHTVSGCGIAHHITLELNLCSSFAIQALLSVCILP